MSKKKLIFWASIILFIALGSIAYLKGNIYYCINDANKNLDTAEMKLLMKEEDIRATLQQKFTIIPGFGGEGYSNEEEGIEVDFSGFPDVLDKHVLTAIETKNPKHSFYDIHPGDDAANADMILTKNGYKKSEGADQFQHRYEKGKITVSMYVNAESSIEKIIIHLESTNKRNVVF